MSGHKFRKVDAIVDRVIGLWHLWLILAGGVYMAISFYNKVEAVIKSQDDWQKGSEARREKITGENAKRDDRLTRLEDDVKWLDKLRREQRERQ